MDELRMLLPGATAYLSPISGPARIDERAGGSVSNWTDRNQTVSWYVKIKTAGPLSLAVALKLPEGSSRLALTLARIDPRRVSRTGIPIDAGGGQRFVGDASAAPAGTEHAFGTVGVTPGYWRVTLSGLSKTGPTFGEIGGLILSGGALKDAHANLKPRRNAASVHLGYPTQKDERVAWFYNEIRVQTDPIWSYYMACGFHRGYFGIQVNSETERRIIFSVWDAGNEAVDRGKVASDKRVRLLKKGDNVVAGDFGNEGTGGHSHKVYDWKTTETHRFLLRAEPDGDTTTYTGWFFFPETRAWGLIATFKAPRDGSFLRGLYSFSENFVGNNGQLLRRARFGPGWVGIENVDKTVAWRELTDARFTCDATGRAGDRIDYAAGVEAGRFYLAHGGFQDNGTKFGDTFTRTASKTRPESLTRLPE